MEFIARHLHQQTHERHCLVCYRLNGHRPLVVRSVGRPNTYGTALRTIIQHLWHDGPCNCVHIERSNSYANRMGFDGAHMPMAVSCVLSVCVPMPHSSRCRIARPFAFMHLNAGAMHVCCGHFFINVHQFASWRVIAIARPCVECRGVRVSHRSSAYGPRTHACVSNVNNVAFDPANDCA